MEGIMKMRSLIVACTLLAIASFSGAEEYDALKIEDMAFCTGVDSWAPVGAARTFPETVGRVYCFTRVTGAADHTAVTHVWYYADEEKARVTLPVKSRSWRTWSSKLILESWTGRWRVDVLTEDGKLLRSSEFLVESDVERE
jgi:hypothetical protein